VPPPAPKMPSLDPTVASILDSSHPTSVSDDEDAILDSLDNDPAISHFREQRLQQLHSELSRAKHMRNLTTSVKRCVVHFFKPDFGRCGVMDGHMEVLICSIGRRSLVGVRGLTVSVGKDLST